MKRSRVRSGVHLNTGASGFLSAYLFDIVAWRKKLEKRAGERVFWHSAMHMVPTVQTVLTCSGGLAAWLWAGTAWFLPHMPLLS
jgi:hypothetical protein